jgi:hypothetical protein
LFGSKEKTLEYLEVNTFLDESRALLLEDMGAIQKAANVHEEEGRLRDAIHICLSNKADASSTARGQNLVLQALWEAMPFGNLTDRDATNTKDLLGLASGFAQPLRDKVSRR